MHADGVRGARAPHNVDDLQPPLHHPCGTQDTGVKELSGWCFERRRMSSRRQTTRQLAAANASAQRREQNMGTRAAQQAHRSSSKRSWRPAPGEVQGE